VRDPWLELIRLFVNLVLIVLLVVILSPLLKLINFIF